MSALRRLYLDGTDLERGSEALVRFRLTYDGSLLSSNPLDPDKRIEHKHDIRRAIHPQLKEHWRTNKYLSTYRHALHDLNDPHNRNMSLLPPRAKEVLPRWSEFQQGRTYFWEDLLAEVYAHSGYKWVPLVRKEISLACSLRIICLRRDGPGSLAIARDLDNRIKTLLDALTMPSFQQGSPMKNGAVLPPAPDETPFFVLLDDDRQITHLEVETDRVLEIPPQHASDESYVRLVISVELRPYDVNEFNLSFA